MIPILPSDFTFITYEESLEYLPDVVESMMRSFGVTREECIVRINQSWSHVPAVAGEDFTYREVPGYWAYEFMFGHGSRWWIDADERQRKGLGPLQRLPYPPAPPA